MAQIPITLYADVPISSSSGSSSKVMPEHYEDLTEGVTNLPMTNGSTPALMKTIYSLKLDNIKAGDLLLVTSAFEVTNNNTYNVMIGSGLFLGNSPNDTTWNTLDRVNAYNVDPAMHHGVVNRHRQYKFPKDYSSVYINLVAWAVSSWMTTPASLLVEQGYGHLDGVLFRA